MPRAPFFASSPDQLWARHRSKLWFLCGFSSSCRKLQVILNPAHEGQPKQEYRDLCFAFGDDHTFIFKPIVTEKIKYSKQIVRQALAGSAFWQFFFLVFNFNCLMMHHPPHKSNPPMQAGDTSWECQIGFAWHTLWNVLQIPIERFIAALSCYTSS